MSSSDKGFLRTDVMGVWLRTHFDDPSEKLSDDKSTLDMVSLGNEMLEVILRYFEGESPILSSSEEDEASDDPREALDANDGPRDAGLDATDGPIEA